MMTTAIPEPTGEVDRNIYDVRSTLAVVGDYGVGDLAALLHGIDTVALAPMHAAYRDLAREVDSYLAQPTRVQATYRARLVICDKLQAVRTIVGDPRTHSMRATVRWYTTDVAELRRRLFDDVGDLAVSRYPLSATELVPVVEYAEALAEALARYVDAALVSNLIAECDSAYHALVTYADRLLQTPYTADIAREVAADLADRHNRAAVSRQLVLSTMIGRGVRATVQHYACRVIDGYDLADALARIDTPTAAEPYYRLNVADIDALARECRARTMYTRWRD